MFWLLARAFFCALRWQVYALQAKRALEIIVEL
jgi:hypothetical protein